MVANWMAYTLAVSLLLGCAALIGERALLRLRLPTRFAWGGALVGVLLLPLVPRAWGWSDAPDAPAAAVVGALEVISPQFDSARSVTWGERAEGWNRSLVLLWAAASLALSGGLLLSIVRLRRRRRGWKKGRVGNTEVWLSDDVGPAVVGLVRGEVVMPCWAKQLPEREQYLLVDHEREHLRARDHWLWGFGLGSVVLIPWNPLIWGMVRRLRAAIEVDCDARVLAGTNDLRSYGALLIDVARRATQVPLMVAGFATGASQLERRVRIMTAAERPRRPWQAAIPAAGAVLLVLASCGLDRPVEPSTGTETESLPVPTDPAGGAPTVMDWERGERLVAALENGGDGVGTDADEQAAPRTTAAVDTPTQRQPPSTQPANPSSSQQPGGEQPEGSRTPAFTSFGVGPNVEPTPPSDLSQTPVFTPFDVRPRLRNAADFGARVDQAYPPMLRDAGIGGTVTMWVFIDREGRVANTRLVQSSGYDQLDRIAEQMMQDVAEFNPAQNRGEPVGVWVQLPITFVPDQSPRQ